MKKGEIITGVIEEIKFPNKGIFHADGYEVQVKNALPGQTVEARIGKKRGQKAEGMLLGITQKAPDEIEAPCPMYGICGGCNYLSLPYEKTLTIKQIQVMKLLQGALDGCGQQGKASENTEAGSAEAAQGCEPTDVKPAATAKQPWQNVMTWYDGIYSSPKIFGFRNKMEFSFGDAVKDGPLELGMHKRGSFYDIADAGNCVTCDEDYQKIVRATRDFFRKKETPFYHRARNTGFLRHLLVRKASHTGEILIDLVTTTQPCEKRFYEEGMNIAENAALVEEAAAAEKKLLADYAQMLQDLEFEGTLTGVLRTKNDRIADVVQDEGTEILFGRDSFDERLLGLQFTVTPFSFFQTNSYSAEVLYSVARKYIDEAVKAQNADQKPLIYDLYCGTGTITQLVSPVASKVIGVEIVEEAVEAAKQNAKRNHIDNCEFIAGDVLKVIDNIEEKPDLIILDPPRDGIHPKAMPKILNYGVEYILYISCKPTSLARDLPAFVEAGYVPVKGCSVDQFVWSSNTETLVLLSNTKKSPQNQA